MTTSCEYHASFTYDGSCRSLGLPDYRTKDWATWIQYPGHGQLFWEPGDGIPSGPIFDEDLELTATPCMAGPRGCGSYAERSCPPGFLPASSSRKYIGINVASTVTFCCPQAVPANIADVVLGSMEGVVVSAMTFATVVPSTEEITFDITTGYFCHYSWLSASTITELPVSILTEDVAVPTQLFKYAAVIAQHVSSQYIIDLPQRSTTKEVASTGTTTITPGPTSNQPIAPENSLSTGARAGIGIGSAVAGLLLMMSFIGGYWILFRRKNRNRKSLEIDGKAQLDGTEIERSCGPTELNAEGEISELYDTGQAVEIGGTDQRVELADTSRPFT